MARRDIIVIGGSAGGVDALMRICGGLPADLPASILVVQHISPASRSVLPDVLPRSSRSARTVSGNPARSRCNASNTRPATFWRR